VTAARLQIEARAIAEGLGVATAPQASVERVAERIERLIREAVDEAVARAVVYLHADRVTTEPTAFAEDAVLRPLLAEGEVALALRPFPSGDGAVVLYGSPEQIAELCEAGIVPFLDDLTEDA
jgi:hypothetical protein